MAIVCRGVRKGARTGDYDLSRMDRKGYGWPMTSIVLRAAGRGPCAALLLLLLLAPVARGDDDGFIMLATPERSRPGEATVAAPIYNGTLTQGFPAVVAVVIFNRDGTSGLCSGTLVTPTIVLTAGHCLSFGLVGALIAIFPDGVTEVDHGAIAGAIHPDFNLAIDAVADVGLLVLDAPVTDVTPTPLATAAPRPHARGTIVGFGDDATSGAGLKRVGTVRLARCPRAVHKIGIERGQLAGSICWRPKRRGEDTCHGDSGGPLLVDDSVAGVTSGGFPDCPGRLSWDTSVAAFRDWIELMIAQAANLPAGG
jgi:hypothetical protein